MALKGSIKEFGLSEIFQLIFHQKKEGLLHLEKEHDSFSICFKDGKVVRAYEGDRDETLGKNLTKAKILSPDQLVISRYRQENTNKSLEGVLVDLEFVSPEELKRLTRLFTEEAIFKVFDWKAGEYEFEQKDVSFNPMLVQPLDTQFILMEAVRQMDEWPLLVKKVGSRKSVFEKMSPSSNASDSNNPQEEQRKTGDPFGDLDGETGEEDSGEEDWLLQQIDGQQTVQAIIDQAQLGVFAVYQKIAELLSEKVIREKKDQHLDEEIEESESGLSNETKKKVLKYLAGSLVSILTVGLFFLSLPSLQVTTLKTAKPFQEVQSLVKQNERYFIRFALDLYYLKHNRYPTTLQELADEALFEDSHKMLQSLDHWTYKLVRGSGDQFLLQHRDTK